MSRYGAGIPTTNDQRVNTYRRQNGSARLTARQRRRATHKRNHGMAPFGDKTGRPLR